MKTTAILIEKPESIVLKSLDIDDAKDDDIVVQSVWSGVSSGTEKLLFTGRMPDFPGLQYPLVPGYETVGRVIKADCNATHEIDDLVFVPGANCYDSAAGLFGASASHLTVPASRAIAVPEQMAETGTLLALAATAHHAVTLEGSRPPDAIVGHGVLGRLIARIVIALGHPAPQIWERDPVRRLGSFDYDVIEGPQKGEGPFQCVLDASGDTSIIDSVMPHLAHGGEIILAGFYGERMSFQFVSAFMREAKLHVAAEFKPDDVHAVLALMEQERLSLEDIISDLTPARSAEEAYASAFSDLSCLKMVIDWRNVQ